MHHGMHASPTLQGAVDGFPGFQIPRSVEQQQVIALPWLELDSRCLPISRYPLEGMRSQPRQQIPAFTLEANRRHGGLDGIRSQLRRTQKAANHSLNASVQAGLEQAGHVKQ